MPNTETETTSSAEPAPDAIDPLAGTKIHYLHGGLSLDTSPAGSGYWEPMHRGREIVSRPRGSPAPETGLAARGWSCWTMRLPRWSGFGTASRLGRCAYRRQPAPSGGVRQ